MKPYTELAYSHYTLELLRRNWRGNANYHRKVKSRVYKKNFRTRAKRGLLNILK